MLAHESASIERKRSVASIWDALFLGHESRSGNVAAFGFRYGTASGNQPGLELSLVMSDYAPPFTDEIYDRDFWQKHNHELGLGGMLAYKDFHIGTHASIDEFKFALYGGSDMEIANKLEELRGPNPSSPTGA